MKKILGVILIAVAIFFATSIAKAEDISACAINPCPPTCTNECTSGTKQCTANGQYQFCGNYDTDPCAEWSTANTCPTGQICTGQGVCAVPPPPCTNQCSPTGKKCVSTTTYKTCTLDCNNGCYVWSSLINQCPYNTTCSNGSCITPPVCTNECTSGAKKCTTDGKYQTCGNSDSDSCTEWLTATTCPTGQTCTGSGVCTATCASTCSSAVIDQWITYLRTSPLRSIIARDDTYGTVNPVLWVKAENNLGCSPTVSEINSRLLLTAPSSVFGWFKDSNGFLKNDPLFGQQDFSSLNCGEIYGAREIVDCAKKYGTGYSCANESDLATRCSGTGDLKKINDVNTYAFCNNGGRYCLKCTTPPPPVCTNECTSGAKKCTTDGKYQTCGNSDSDSCTEWLTATTCPTGQTCTGSGVCTVPPPTCTNGCASTEKACVTNTTYKVCSLGDNGCYDWSSIVNTCPYNTTCSNGSCMVNPPSCTNECTSGSKQCSGTGYQFCGNYDSDSCTEWSSTNTCPTGQACTGQGVCTICNDCVLQTLDVSCFAAPSIAKRGELSWVVARVAGGVGPYQYSWSGDFSGTEQTVSRVFFNKGNYNAYLTVTAGDQTKSATCQAQVSDEIAVYANHSGSGNIWVSNTTVYTGEAFTISVFGADEDGIDEIQTSYQNSWHSQSVSGNSATRNWQVTEYTPNRYLYCGKIVGRTLTGARDVSYTNPRCIEVTVRSR